jgi:hypothetical protein
VVRSALGMAELGHDILSDHAGDSSYTFVRHSDSGTESWSAGS